MAKRCHTIRRARTPLASAAPPFPTPLAALPDLTDARWNRIVPLLPPDAATGRPAQDARTALAGIVWIVQHGAAWSDLPAAFGSPQTVNRRYHRWRADGTWDLIIAALMAPAP